MSSWGDAWQGASGLRFILGGRLGRAHQRTIVAADLLALQTFLLFERRCHVLLVTASLVSAHVVRNNTSRSPRQIAKLGFPYSLVLRRWQLPFGIIAHTGIFLVVVQRPAILGVWALFLSSHAAVLVAPQWPRQQWYKTTAAVSPPNILLTPVTPPSKREAFAFKPPPAGAGMNREPRLLRAS